MNPTNLQAATGDSSPELQLLDRGPGLSRSPNGSLLQLLQKRQLLQQRQQEQQQQVLAGRAATGAGGVLTGNGVDISAVYSRGFADGALYNQGYVDGAQHAARGQLGQAQADRAAAKVRIGVACCGI